jgi:uncharacterized protein YkwD
MTKIVSIHFVAIYLVLSAACASAQTPGAGSAAPTSETTHRLSFRRAAFQGGAANDDQGQLLSLMNEARARTGAPALRLESHLSAAAQEHAMLMAKRRELSHQFPGEPPLSDRLLASGEIRLDKMGENVALDVTIEGANDHFLHSPPHRKNLLDPDFNLVGLAIVRSGEQIYVVQDFGHGVTNYSSDKAADAVAQAIGHARRDHGSPSLERVYRADLHDVACTMAQEGKLDVAGARPFSQTYHVLKYSSPVADTLPQGTDQLILSREVSKVSVGACAAAGKNYFVIVLLY